MGDLFRCLFIYWIAYTYIPNLESYKFNLKKTVFLLVPLSMLKSRISSVVVEYENKFLVNQPVNEVCCLISIAFYMARVIVNFT